MKTLHSGAPPSVHTAGHTHTQLSANQAHGLKADGTQPISAAPSALLYLGAHPEPQMSQAVLRKLVPTVLPPAAEKTPNDCPESIPKDFCFFPSG